MSELTSIVNSLSDEKIISIMQELSCTQYKDTREAIIFPTLCHHMNEEDGSLKLYYYKNSHMFHCYTECGDNFNIIELLKRHYEVCGIKYNFYRDIVSKISDGNNRYVVNGFEQKYESDYNKFKKKDFSINLKKYSPQILNMFQSIPIPDWIEEGISEQSQALYNIRYSIAQEKIIIPHYDINNNLIGIRGRALKEEDIAYGKYMPLQIDDTIYSHPLMYNLYGINIVKDNLKKYKTAIVVEGEKSVLKSDSLFGTDRNIVVATCGSTLHRFQIDLLRKCGVNNIILAYDKEGEGTKGKTKYYNKLNKICSKFKNIVNISFIWDTKDLLNLKDSPIDRGKDVFEELIRSAIRV